MSDNSKLPRNDGRAQPRIEEPDEENLNYEDLASNKDEMPTTSSYPEKDSPQDLDHPDIMEDLENEKPTKIKFPGKENHPITQEGDFSEEVEIVDTEDEEFPLDPEKQKSSRFEEDSEDSNQ